MRPALAAAVLAAVIAFMAPTASAAVHATRVGSFRTPVYAAAPPGDPHRLFVVEKDGRIMVLRDGRKLKRPFLDVRRDVTAIGDHGLLSMAFARDYARSRRVFVYYVAPRPGDKRGGVITIQRMRTRRGHPNVVDPASRRTLFTVDHPDYTDHDGGQIQFGPDGMLYAATGDGGCCEDPGNAQSPWSPLGKMLRIDPRTGATTMYASGLRNPWRFSFDRRTGDLIVADVGLSLYEEVDFAPAGDHPGANYGWPCFEGFHSTGMCSTNPSGTVKPVLERFHGSDGNCAIVGGYVVRDRRLTGLTGRYLYGDNCAPALHSARLVAPPARVRDDRAAGIGIEGLASFGEDSCGHVYAVSGLGPVYRIDGDAFRPCPARRATRADDNRPPKLVIRARRVQRVVSHEEVRIRLRCDETCGATTRATMRIAGSRKRYRLRPATRQLAAHRRAKVTLRLTTDERAVAQRALLRHRRVRFVVRVTARDAAGNATRRSRIIRARG